MRRAWCKIFREAQSCIIFLEDEMPEVLATPLPGLGNGSLNGSTRSKVMEAREQIQAKVLNKVLEAVRPKSTRAAWAWRQQDMVRKARAAYRRQGVPEGVVARVEQKPTSLGQIAGIVVGNFGDVSEATHSLLAALATSQVRMAGVTRGKRGYWKQRL